jgi:hypothetical protein
MEEINELLDQNKLETGVEFDGLLSKTARINNSIGCTAEDVLGWDYLVRSGNTCSYFYAAQAPLIGMTQPGVVICPLGLRVFDSYNIDFRQAIEKLNTVNCGIQFVVMSLYWPLTSQITEPEWHIRTSLGCEVVIGANSGKIAVDDPSGKIDIPSDIIPLYMAAS